MLGGFVIFITDSVSSLVRGLLRSSIRASILVGCAFLGMYPFHPGYPVCWCTGHALFSKSRPLFLTFLSCRLSSLLLSTMPGWWSLPHANHCSAVTLAGTRRCLSCYARCAPASFLLSPICSSPCLCHFRAQGKTAACPVVTMATACVVGWKEKTASISVTWILPPFLKRKRKRKGGEGPILLN